MKMKVTSPKMMLKIQIIGSSFLKLKQRLFKMWLMLRQLSLNGVIDIRDFCWNSQWKFLDGVRRATRSLSRNLCWSGEAFLTAVNFPSQVRYIKTAKVSSYLKGLKKGLEIKLYLQKGLVTLFARKKAYINKLSTLQLLLFLLFFFDLI